MCSKGPQLESNQGRCWYIVQYLDNRHPSTTGWRILVVIRATSWASSVILLWSDKKWLWLVVCYACRACMSLTKVPLTPRFHRVHLRRVTAALRPRYGRVTAALRLRHKYRGHSSQWVLFHQTRRVTAQKRYGSEASQKRVGEAPGRKWTGQSIRPIPKIN